MAINLLPMATQSLLWQVTRNENARTDAERDALLNSPDLGFGKTFTDHMVDICWSEHGGWHRPRVRPYGPTWPFPPEQKAARMQRSARRLALPELPTEYFIESIKQLVAVDGAWVPS